MKFTNSRRISKKEHVNFGRFLALCMAGLVFLRSFHGFYIHGSRKNVTHIKNISRTKIFFFQMTKSTIPEISQQVVSCTNFI